MTAAEIRAKYPKPIMAGMSPDLPRVDRYCVAGAACRFVAGDDYTLGSYFPLPHTASEILGVSRLDILEIESANDSGEFNRAWQLLDEALKAKGLV